MNKIIVLDLDGTLLKDNKTISNKTIYSLLNCKKQNNQIIFATARAPRDVYEFIPKELHDSPIICYNGACIMEAGKIINKKEIKRNTVLKVIDVAKRFDEIQICIEINNKLYSNFEPSKFFGKVKYEMKKIQEMNFTKAFKVIICSNDEIDNKLIEELPLECNAIITDNGKLCQIMKRNVSKWSALKVLLRRFNKKSEDIIAFGDDYNDLEIMQNTPISIAMENAEDDIKKVAKYITSSNEEDGVGRFLDENQYLYMRK